MAVPAETLEPTVIAAVMYVTVMTAVFATAIWCMNQSAWMRVLRIRGPRVPEIAAALGQATGRKVTLVRESGTEPGDSGPWRAELTFSRLEAVAAADMARRLDPDAKADIGPVPGRRRARTTSVMTDLPVSKYGNTLTK
ncbi:hypothetical protein ACFFSY_12170 [Paenibacillus aurantiacus]|uniref:Uncharacterized protein n=1 Tax=Paenibacillus aurantiacus TaxID=1936118 RepID=A0ABV5KN75_9BACL